MTNILEKYRSVEDALAKAFDHFNQVFAKGEMNPPIIVVASDPSDKKLGHFHRNSWIEIGKGENDEDVEVRQHEIKINATHIPKQGIKILETLLHEMAHQWCEMKGIQDTAGVRHNTKFKEAAEMFGLHVEKQGHRGWAYTDLTEKSQKAIDELELDEDIFKIGFSVEKVKKEGKTISLQIDKTEENEQMMEELAAKYGSKKEAVKYALTRLFNEE